MKNNETSKVRWEDIVTLESIANQCIYNGKEVAEARSILRTVYGKIADYDDDENCEIVVNESNPKAKP